MAFSEFELINRFFKRPVHRASIGIGDDCALLMCKPGTQLAVSSDMLVEGRHFLSTVNPKHLGHKALAVNLSDLAACGARPLGFTLALSLPRADESFLQPFSQGLLALAENFECELIGGDTTQGPLNICITVLGEVAESHALLRDGAKAGNDIYVSGQVGDARLALEVFRGQMTLTGEDFTRVRRAMEQPVPRVELGLALSGLATSAIDVSDGLLGDLQHILDRSQVGALIWIEEIPISAVLGSLPTSCQRLCALAGGDDYELVFTASPVLRPQIQQLSQRLQLALTRIGEITHSPGIELRDAHGQLISQQFSSFDHFA
jgi:thiamine-monophosphate kinase